MFIQMQHSHQLLCLKLTNYQKNQKHFVKSVNKIN